MVESSIVTAIPRTEPKPPVGVIESLTTGFETIASHIGLALFPALLDLFLWLGPRLSISPLTQSLIKYVQDSGSPTDEGMTQFIEAAITLLKLAGERTNVFNFLSTSPLGVPSLIDLNIFDSNPVGQPLVLGIDNALIFFTLALGLIIIGLLLGTIYFVLIGAQFTDDGLTPISFIKNVILNWARVTALGLVAVIFILTLSFIIVFFVSVLQLMLFGLSSVVPGASEAGLFIAALSQALLGMLILWVLLFLVFSVHGMVLKNRGVVSSMWDSIRLVQWNLLSVVGLFLLIYVINIGLRYLFSLPSPQSWLMLAGIGGHAFISTGLVAATFAYYKDRYRWWTEMREWLLTQRRAGGVKRGA